MREILFRGKTEIGNVWREGYYIKREDMYGNVEHRITKSDGGFFVVIPETVGQYTGLTDKNGKRIFEGDILEFINEYRGQNNKWKCVVEFVDGSFICRFLETSGRLGEYNHFDTWNAPLVKWWVIGNIHDNPGCMGEQQAELATSPELTDAAE